MSKVLKIVGTIAGIAGAIALAIPSGGTSLALAASGMFGMTVGGALAVVGMASAIGATLLAKKPKSPAVSEDQLSRLQISIDPRTPRKMVFGTTAMATDILDQEFSDKQTYLHRFVVVASHKVNAVKQIWFDDKLAWTSAGGAQGDFAGYLTVTPKLEGNAANAVNISARMGTSRRYTGCAYLHMRYKLTGNSKKVESPFAQNIPSRVTIIGDGMSVYDPRLDSTVPGGSGSCRADNQATWVWNANAGNNPALGLLTWLIGYKINGKLAVGKGIPTRRIDLQSFITAANLCDEPVTLAAGGTEPRYRAKGVLSEGEDNGTILEMFKAAMNADLDDVDGKIRLSVYHNDLAVPVAHFGPDDILAEVEWRQTPALVESFNIVRGSFIDPSQNSLYQAVEYPEKRIANTDGIDRIFQFNLGMVESSTQAQRLANQRLQRQQFSGLLTATFQITAWKVQKGDIVSLSFPSLGFVNKLFRIVEMEHRVDGTVPMTLREEHAAIYAWDKSESATVSPAPPINYDFSQHPLIEAVASPQWTDIVDNDPNVRPRPDDGATVGAPAGTPVGDRDAETVNQQLDDNASGLESTNETVATVQQDVLNLEEVFGTTQSASEYAAAAQDAQELAQQAQGLAQDARDLAQAARNTATQAKTDAGLARDAAQSARTGAETALASATTQKNAAEGFASASNASANIATAKAGDANASAISANQSKLDAQSARDMATTKANLTALDAATTTADRAAVLSDRTLTASYKNGFATDLAMQFPKPLTPATFTDASVGGGGPETLQTSAYDFPPSKIGAGNSFIESSKEQLTCKGGIAFVPGRIYKIFADVEMTASPAGSGSTSFYFRLLAADWTSISNAGPYKRTDFTANGQRATLTMTLGQSVSGVDYIIPANANYVKLRPILLLNRQSGSAANQVGTMKVYSFWVEDITESVASGNNATIASNASSVATAHSAVAQTQAELSAQSATAAGAARDTAVAKAEQTTTDAATVATDKATTLAARDQTVTLKSDVTTLKGQVDSVKTSVDAKASQVTTDAATVATDKATTIAARDQASTYRNEAEGFKNTAQTQAGLAQTASTQADAARAAAVDNKNLSASFAAQATAAARKLTRADFNAGDDHWVYSFGQTEAGYASASSPSSVPDILLLDVANVGKVLQAPNYRIMSERVGHPFIEGEEIEITLKTRVTVDRPTADGPHMQYVWMVCTDANGAAAGYTAVAIWSGLKVADGWVERKATFNPVAKRASSVAPVNTATQWRLMVGINGYNSAGTKGEVQQIATIDIADVTQRNAAAAQAAIASTQAAIASTQAGIASTQASVATGKAAEALASMRIAASVTSNYLNSNSGFDDYPSANVGALPYRWTNWTQAGGAYRVEDQDGGWAIRIPGGAGLLGGILFTDITSKNVRSGTYYVLETAWQLMGGSHAGAGILCRFVDSAFGKVQDHLLSLEKTPDALGNVIGVGTIGQTYRLSTLFQLTGTGIAGYRLYVQNHYTEHGSTAEANDIIWLKCGLREATKAEIETQTALPAMQASITQTQAAITDLQANKASATSVTALTTSVGNLQSNYTAQQTSITDLQNNKASASSVSGLDVQVQALGRAAGANNDNKDFSGALPLAGWSAGPDAGVNGRAGNALAFVTPVQNIFGYASGLRVDAAKYVTVFSDATYPVVAGRKYKLKAKMGTAAGSASPNPVFYLGVVGLDANGVRVDHGATFGIYRYAAARAVAPTPGGLNEYSAVMEGFGNDSLTKFPPGTAQVRLVALVNQNAANLPTYLTDFDFVDVTETAAMNASIASNQSAVVDLQANKASVASVTTLNTSVGGLQSNYTSQQASITDLQNNKASVASVNSLTTTVNGHTASVTSQQTSISGLQAGWGFKLDVNGRISGMSSVANGTTSKTTFLADVFEIWTSGGAKRPFSVTADRVSFGTDIHVNQYKIIFDTGTVMRVQGLGFGTAGQFVDWFGPSMAVSACAESNAYYYLKTNGAGFWGRGIVAGTLSTSAATSSLANNAQAETASFGSNGGTLTVTMTYMATGLSNRSDYEANMSGRQAWREAVTAFGATYDTAGNITGGQSKVVNCSISARLDRSASGSSYSDGVATLSITQAVVSIDGAGPTPGDAPGSLRYHTSVEGSITFTDPQANTQNRRYRAVLTGVSMPFGPTTQRLAIVTSE